MGNSTLRCCLACVLPCGALDLIRIVHLNGNVEELTGPITAGEVLKNNANHVLTKLPTSQGVVRKILILSPTTELKKGGIYFLIPSSSLPENKKPHKNPTKNACKKVKKCKDSVPESYVVMEKKTAAKGHHRRSSTGTRVGVWRPHLESIYEESH